MEHGVCPKIHFKLIRNNGYNPKIDTLRQLFLQNNRYFDSVKILLKLPSSKRIMISVIIIIMFRLRINISPRIWC